MRTLLIISTLAFFSFPLSTQDVVVDGKIGIDTDNPSQAIDMGGRLRNIRFDYTHLGETGSGAATILANKARVSETINNRVDYSDSNSDGVSAIELFFENGISFFTRPNGLPSTEGGQFFSVNDRIYERMRITGDGNVGIGKINPQYKVDITGSIRTNQILYTSGIHSDPNDNTFAIFELRAKDNVDIFIDADESAGIFNAFRVYNANQSVLSVAENGEFEIWNGATPNNRRLWLETNGDLHIDGTLDEGSDRNRKEAIYDINDEEILDKVSMLPIYEWQYIGQDRRHIGPIAQDFHATFGLGKGDTSISTIDRDGVALAAIKALYAQNKNQQSEIDVLKQEMAELRMLLKAQVMQDAEEE